MKSFFFLPAMAILFFLLGLPGTSAFTQGLSKSAKKTDELSQRDHIPYDDSTLTSLQRPYAMPYNRWIDPAGFTVRFGDPKLENHSLDAVLLPGGKLLAVEDRFGIILFRADRHQVMARYSFSGDHKYGQLMSTY